MKISYNWLKEYVDFDIDYLELGKILTDTGLEVEGIDEFQSVKGGLEGLVIGEVKTKEKHPDADKLSITTVDIGLDDILHIVCGAPNVEASQKVLVAPIGTTLYSANKSFKIKKTKIRGALSEGMICAEDEVGLGTSHDGIMVLEPDAKIGAKANEYFNIENDWVYEIGLTPNRIDGASHYGTARDLAAFLNLEKPVIAHKISVDNFKSDNNDRNISVTVEDADACPRYSGITISSVEIKESPNWLQNRLRAIGLTPINNVVDITNFVLHETGQPLHAFDADKIKGDQVIVKTLPNGTLFTTLDEEKRELSNEDLMICNSEEGMCIAGVFGGIDSGVTEKTTTIFLESANFNPVYVRKTSRRHMLFSDSAFRFERGADVNNTIYALKRAALLIKEIAGGNISSEIIDVYPKQIEGYKVDLKFSHIDRLVGKKIPLETIKKILVSLDIKIVSENETVMTVLVPTYRIDVQREVDVIEEIMRIYGFNNIEFSEKIKSTLNHLQKPDKDKLQNTISDLLSASGFNEIMSNSLTKERYYDKLQSLKPENLVQIYNPLSIDLNCMRQTLLFGGLEAIAYNINRKNSNLKFFEFGNCYFYNKRSESDTSLKDFSEQKKLELFITGQKQENSWVEKPQNSNLFQIKSNVENILIRLGIDVQRLDFKDCELDIFADGISYYNQKSKLASFGMLNSQILHQLNIEQNVYYAEIIWENLINLAKNHKVEFDPLPKYPGVKRDLALLLDKTVKFNDIKDLAFKTERKLLKSVNLFDVYEGEGIDSSKKSYALSFMLLDINKTLTDKQIDKIMNNFISVFENELGAQLR